MSQFKITGEVEIIDNAGNKRLIPFRNNYTSVNEIWCQEIAFDADDTLTVWDPTNWSGYQFTAFDRLMMMSTRDLDVEMTINEGDANEELISFRLAANVPFFLGADDAYYNHSASNIYAGTLDVIDKIRIDEPNSTAGKLTMVMVD